MSRTLTSHDVVETRATTVNLKEGLQVNLRGRGRVGQVEVAEHLGVHGAEEADDLATGLEE